MYAWNSISKAGSGFRSSLPKSIANELKQKQKDEERLRRRQQDPRSPMSVPKDHMTSLNPSNFTTNGGAPKGCFCQMGSIFRAILCLIFIVAASGGVFYWIYMTQLAPASPDHPGDKTIYSQQQEPVALFTDEEYILQAILDGSSANEVDHDHDEYLEKVRKSKAMLDMEINFSQEQLDDQAEDHVTTQEPLELTAVRDKNVQLYIDFEGKLHKISDLKKNQSAHEGLLEDLEVPMIVEAITEAPITTTTEVPVTTTIQDDPEVTITPGNGLEDQEVNTTFDPVSDYEDQSALSNFMPTPVAFLVDAANKNETFSNDTNVDYDDNYDYYLGIYNESLNLFKLDDWKFLHYT
jgi:hypothetical protein